MVVTGALLGGINLQNRQTQLCVNASSLTQWQRTAADAIRCLPANVLDSMGANQETLSGESISNGCCGIHNQTICIVCGRNMQLAAAFVQNI